MIVRNICSRSNEMSAHHRAKSPLTISEMCNRIETWFSILQGQSLNGASFTSVEELQEHIDAFISAYNETATPFAWTKKRVYQRRFKNGITR